MNPRTTGILLVVALVLGAFVWFYEIEGEEARREAEAAETRLFPEIEAADVETVWLTTTDGVEVRLARGEEGWSLVEPLDFPADAFAADGLASNLADLTSESVFENPQPAEEYGLADGATRVRFEAAGEQRALRIGAETPIGANRYARVDDDEAVLTIPTYQATAFEKSLTDLRERRILPFDPASIREVEASWPGGSVTLVRTPEADAEPTSSGTEWRLVAPLEGRADDRAVNDLLSNLAFLRADDFVDDPSPPQKAAFEEPAFRVVLRGEAAEGGETPTWRLAVGPVDEGDRRLVKGAEASLYTIAAERIRDFPREVVDYRFKRLTDFRIGDVHQVDLFFRPAAGDPVVVSAVRGDDGWTASPEPLDPGRIARLVSELAGLEAVDIVSEDASEVQLAELELAPPNTILTVFAEPDADAEGEASALPKLAEIHLGRVEGSEWIVARAEGDPAVYRLAYELAEHVPVSLEAFRNRFANEAEPEEDAPLPADAKGPEFLSPSEESP